MAADHMTVVRSEASFRGFWRFAGISAEIGSASESAPDLALSLKPPGRDSRCDSACSGGEKTAPDCAVDLCRQGEALVVLHLQKL
jgi:hypothetical protein